MKFPPELSFTDEDNGPSAKVTFAENFTIDRRTASDVAY
jgi:hypothetical protein